MKKIYLFPWLGAFLLIFGFSGAVFGGGPEDPACLVDPFPDFTQCDETSIWGEITVAREAPRLFPPNNYNVHMVLRDAPMYIVIESTQRGKPTEVHLFSFSSPLAAGDLCSLNEDELIGLFFRIFCQLGVQEKFDFDGIPVFEELKIVRTENCDADGEMIQMYVVICDVPLE